MNKKKNLKNEAQKTKEKKIKRALSLKRKKKKNAWGAGRRIKESSRGDEFKYDIFDTL
jgi:hypothetical protein